MWAVLSAMYPAKKHADRPSSYPSYLEYKDKLNFEGINFPASFKDIDKFEKLNPKIAIWVYGWDEGVFPCRETKNNQCENIIDLMLLGDGEDSHYVWIKSMSRLLNKHNKH